MAFVIEDAQQPQGQQGRFVIEPDQSPSLLTHAKNLGMGALKGASDIGATILQPIDYISDKITGKTNPNVTSLVTGEKPKSSNEERRAALADFFREHADTESLAFKGGELAADIAGTAGVGGVLAKGVRAVGAAFPVIAQYAPKLAAALETGGFRLGGEPATTVAGKVANAATRVGAGAAVGGASVGMVNPDEATTGAVLGGALPVAAKVAGAAGRALAGKVSPEVAALYQKAKDLGIDIPADRIVNSKPLNAVAASLNYIPFSGRTATEDRMVSQINRALSKTFGQDSDNVTLALRKASDDLGSKFETTLKNNTVKVDDKLLTDLASSVDTAHRELGTDGAKIIGNQAEEILNKVGANGEIDGQAAYNIKKTLDRIGNRNSPEAYYARELKKSLMGALNRSLGPEEAANFAKVRQQYGNMLDLEGLAQNGAEGGISIGRLANLKNINNPQLQDIADIAAQFGKVRENPHGAAQRVVLGAMGAGVGTTTGTLPLVAGGVAAGRVANTALNSGAVKNALLNQGAVANRLNTIGSDRILRSLAYTSANRQSSP